MTKLPFDANTLAGLTVPDDTTLKVLRNLFLNGSVARELKGMSKLNRIRIIFLIGDDEAPDTMTISEFRNTPKMKIVVDDGEGGWKTKPLTPELIH